MYLLNGEPIGVYTSPLRYIAYPSQEGAWELVLATADHSYVC